MTVREWLAANPFRQPAEAIDADAEFWTGYAAEAITFTAAQIEELRAGKLFTLGLKDEYSVLIMREEEAAS